MTLVDANILLFAVNEASASHARAASWLSDRLNGNRPVGLPWQSLAAFVRIATNPRASRNPLDPETAWTSVEEWLAAAPAWVPAPTPRHGEILGNLVRRYELRGNLVSDAVLATLAIEHGLTVCSADTDFARFSEVRWENPLADVRPGGGAQELRSGS
ncbi:MAG: TA system VapC family ribonuclease toxin [Acidimicrobiales bacterium]